MIPFLVKQSYKDVELFQDTKLVYNIHHPENLGIFDEKILDLISIPDSVDRKELLKDGKVDLRNLGMKFSDHVVTGNQIKDQLDDELKELDIEATKIQGSPEMVSDKFADYYEEIAGTEEDEEE